jgi:hypothetical protein
MPVSRGRIPGVAGMTIKSDQVREYLAPTNLNPIPDHKKEVFT